MYNSREHETAEESPYDAEGRVEVPGAPDWQYGSIGGDGAGGLAVELSGPAELRFAVPDFMNRGDELGEVARIVIRAWERKERTKGLGA